MKPKYWSVIILAAVAIAASVLWWSKQPATYMGPIVVPHHKIISPSPGPADLSSLDTSASSTSATSSPTTQIDTSGWKTYTDYDYGYSFQYPGNWTDAGFRQYSDNVKDYFTAPPQVEVLDLDILNSSKSPKEVAEADIANNNCPSGDSMISSSDTDALYTESCSATTEDYIYIVQAQPGTYVKLSYHDNFDENWPQAQKLAVLNQIISTFMFNVSFDMSNWKAYTNNVFGFSINHPIATSADYQPTIDQEVNDYNASSTYLTFGGGYYIAIQENPSHLTLHDWFEKNVDENGILLKNQNFKLITTQNNIQAMQVQEYSTFPDDYIGDGGKSTDPWYIETPDSKYIISYNYDYQDDGLIGYGIPGDDGVLLGEEVLKSFQFTK